MKYKVLKNFHLKDGRNFKIDDEVDENDLEGYMESLTLHDAIQKID